MTGTPTSGIFSLAEQLSQKLNIRKLSLQNLVYGYIVMGDLRWVAQQLLLEINGKTFNRGNLSYEDYFNHLKENGFNTFEAHHIFPVDLFKNEDFTKWYEAVGHKEFDFNAFSSLDNLIILDKKKNNIGVHT
ncbi:hypothetical protein [Flammeovirga kamogawensis]|uniref:DUF1524 domain-containing protein n=1 Tax=Flammeovirga kamogawensis TaxID=373891 RepID=A0ABX8H3F8_9BACT|nr:hypothetical protein [Flammeovirga kamogawensis]MBB6460287.1 hypothetical protein [Flammeovirga kamogawensis]QWG10097.1 hypothetical protein KM029_20660 [Flammeovirga kamogawensis]TRX65604.1 hypothetical protein EO216_24090 [Flammeovirga kamogawensis]